MGWNEELDLAVEAAKAAGGYLWEAFDHDKKVLSETGSDIKLEADREAEQLALGVLSRSSFDVLAEESGEHGALAGDQPFWAVDPLDGTLNFKQGIPLCCVSIALTRPNDPILGVIYDFNRDELFSGIVGEGAWLNGHPMSVSSVTEAGQGIVSTGLPMHFTYDAAGLADYAARLMRFKKIRQFGSAALSLAYVACGRVDAYQEDSIMFWDIAAGAALVRAAGGYVHMKDTGDVKWAKCIRGASRETIWNP